MNFRIHTFTYSEYLNWTGSGCIFLVYYRQCSPLVNTNHTHYNMFIEIVIQFSSSSSWTASVFLWHAHNVVVVFHYRIRVQKYTRLCPYCYDSILGPFYIFHLTIFSRNPTSLPPYSLQSHLWLFSSPESSLY